MKQKKSAAEPIFRLARPDEAGELVDFINDNFDWRLPLVNRKDFFTFYYREKGLQFAVAEIDGAYAAACGYILANEDPVPDIWASVFVARRDCTGAGLQLMAKMPELTGADVVACNNIRGNTLNLYRFLGWTAERVSHYYRIADRTEFRLCRPSDTNRLPVHGTLTLHAVSEAEAASLPFPQSELRPRKDLHYLLRRYYHYPNQSYEVRSVCRGGVHLAYLVTRTVESGEHGEIPVLRIVDYIGDPELLPELGAALDALLKETGAEYADCYNVGIRPELWAEAGFRERTPEDSAVIPNYLTPPLYENTEYFYFTNKPEGFVLFKADGDQDRPNLS